MKEIYESFYEIAEDFVDGNNWTHSLSKHTSDECIPWQKGILEFAEWLDKAGLKIIQNPDIFNALWKINKNREI